MPVSVRLDLVPPAQDDVVALRIFEAATETGSFVQIERTTVVGVFPTYISRYTTLVATSITDWFKIAWEFTGGVVGPQSMAVQGGQPQPLIGKVIERVLQRDPLLVESVVAQEAEGVIEGYFAKNPYDITLTASYQVLNGLVLLTLYRSQLVRYLQSATTDAADSFTIGLVSAKSGTTTSTTQKTEAALAKLLELAQAELGVPTSLILQLAQPCDWQNLMMPDQSRLIAWVTIP